MKNTIKKILKEESLKQNLKQQVKAFGFEETAELVGGTENLVKLGFNNNPMEFLNLFNDLDVVQSEEMEDWALFRYIKHENIMIYDRENDEVYVNHYKIWLFLEDGFGLTYDETQSLIETWLGDIYNLRGIKVYINGE
jgi:hypothetical protein